MHAGLCVIKASGNLKNSLMSVRLCVKKDLFYMGTVKSLKSIKRTANISPFDVKNVI